MCVCCKLDYMELIFMWKYYVRIDLVIFCFIDFSCGFYFYNSFIMVIRVLLGGCGIKVGLERNLLGFCNEVYVDFIGRFFIVWEFVY